MRGFCDSVQKLSIVTIINEVDHGCGELSSPALHLFDSPCHLVYFLLQASDGFILLFRAGICSLRRISYVSQLESKSQSVFVKRLNWKSLVSSQFSWFSDFNYGRVCQVGDAGLFMRADKRHS